MEKENSKKWYQRNWLIIACFFLSFPFILFLPLALYLMWKSNAWNKRARWIITSFFLILFLPRMVNPILNKAGVNNSSNNSQESNNKEETSPPSPNPSPKGEVIKLNMEKEEARKKAAEEKKKEEERKENEKRELIKNLGTIYCENHTSRNCLVDFTKYNFPNFSPEAGGSTQEKCEEVISKCLKLWSQEECEHIAEGNHWTGMTSLQAIISIGAPNDINKTVVGSFESQQWIYGNITSKAYYLYFEGERGKLKLTSWQEY